MNIILSLLVLPQMVILYLCFHLHMLSMPMIREMASKLPDEITQRLGESIVFKVATITSSAYDMIFNWWFVIIPLFALVIEGLVLVLKRQSDGAFRAGTLMIITFISTMAFLSLSAQMMALLMLSAHFIK